MKKYVESPVDAFDEDGSKYITKGKTYETSKGFTHMCFRIKDDDGCEIYCLYTGCSHLKGVNWIKVKTE